MKRVIALIISVAMIASLATGLAVTGFADAILDIDSEKWTDGSGGSADGIDVSFDGEGTYTITVIGTPATLSKINASGANLVIDIPSGKTLEINNTKNEGIPGEINAIYVNGGNLTIKGEGTLNATAASSYAIQSTYGKITIAGATVNATGNGTNSTGMYSQYGNITISGTNTTIEANGKTNGIYSGNKITITGGKVSATNGMYGIYAKNGITISETDTVVEATGSNKGLYVVNYGDITINSGNVTAIAPGEGGHGISTENGNIKVFGGIVKAIAAKSTGIYSCGGNVEISGGEVTAEGSTYGMEAEYQIKLSGGYVRAKGSATMPAYRSSNDEIFVDGVEINDNATAQNAFYCENDKTHTIIKFGEGVQCNEPGDHFICYGIPPTGIKINEKDIAECYNNYGATKPTVNGNTVTVNKISSDTDVTINIPEGKTLVVSTTDNSVAIFVGKGSDFKNLKITGGGTLEAYSNDDEPCISANDVTIDGCSVIASGQYGLSAEGELHISTNKLVKAKGTQSAFIAVSGGIYVDEELITVNNVENYFTGEGVAFEVISFATLYDAIKGTGYITATYSPDGKEDLEDDSVDESDPDVEIDFGYGLVTVKTSNKTLVLNDKKLFEVSIGEGDVFIPVDLSNTPVKLDGIFLNNDVYKYISGSGKGIELQTRFARADIFKKDDVGLNPLSLHLSDVSEIAGTCATAIQKKAMQTSNIYAEVNYSFVTNGKPTDNTAKIYVPVPAEAKVFYLFNEGKIGTVPCENKDGYCVFDRYYDGTYVVCATK